MVFNSAFRYLDLDRYERYQFAMLAVTTGLLCTFWLLGNILSFITFGRMKQNNASVVLFRALTIADSLFLLTAIIYKVTPVFAGYMDYSSPLFDEVYMYIRMCFPAALTIQCSTIWIAVFLAINRYIVICKPLAASRLCTESNARKQLFLVKGLIFTIMSPRFFERYIKTHGDFKITSHRSWARESWYEILSGVLYGLFFFL